MTISSWSDAYCRLLEEAFASRGSAAAKRPLDATPSLALRDWPNTLGADVLAIAAVVDSTLAPLPDQQFAQGARMQWQLAIVELEEAFEQPTATYSRNRSFWSALLGIAAYLDSVHARLPGEDVWDSLVAVLWSPEVDYRNGAGTTRAITDSDAEKMWTKQRDELAQERGFDLRAPPPPSNEAPMKVPRTTNADVIRLYEYWYQQLLSMQIASATGRFHNTMGLPTQMERWNAIRDDIDELARKGKSEDVYAKNVELWRETRGLAVNLAAWGAQPSNFDLVLGAAGHGITELPNTLRKAAGAVTDAIGAGIFAALKKPLLIGGGVLLGTLVLWRLTGSRDSSHA